jgi:iron(III) transport system ATP-binding protein
MLSVRDLYANYVDAQGKVVRAVQGVSFDVPEGELFTLLGPSGCGKTTTMRSVAGLERPVSGEVLVHGEAVYSSGRGLFVAPNKRNFGMVFQSYAIWPHMSVFQNAAFPLQVGAKKLSAQQIKDKVMHVLTVVGLDGFMEREATALSGGQQQRLALARALAMEPRLLLLDEPLSNLDAKLRERMRFEIKRLQRELGLTTIYVTHDQSEALALSHEIAVMNEGRIVQIGSPRDIYERPCNRFVADFVGSTNFVDAVVAGAGAEPHLYQAQSAIGLLTVYSVDPLRAGDAILVSIRPEDVAIGAADLQGPNVVAGTVDLKVFLGEAVDFQIRVGERQLLARAHPSVAADVGSRVSLRMQPQQCISIRSER